MKTDTTGPRTIGTDVVETAQRKGARAALVKAHLALLEAHDAGKELSVEDLRIGRALAAMTHSWPAFHEFSKPLRGLGIAELAAEVCLLLEQHARSRAERALERLDPSLPKRVQTSLSAEEVLAQMRSTVATSDLDVMIAALGEYALYVGRTMFALDLARALHTTGTTALRLQRSSLVTRAMLLRGDAAAAEAALGELLSQPDGKDLGANLAGLIAELKGVDHTRDRNVQPAEALLRDIAKLQAHGAREAADALLGLLNEGQDQLASQRLRSELTIAQIAQRAVDSLHRGIEGALNETEATHSEIGANLSVDASELPIGSAIAVLSAELSRGRVDGEATLMRLGQETDAPFLQARILVALGTAADQQHKDLDATNWLRAASHTLPGNVAPDLHWQVHDRLARLTSQLCARQSYRHDLRAITARRAVASGIDNYLRRQLAVARMQTAPRRAYARALQNLTQTPTMAQIRRVDRLSNLFRGYDGFSDRVPHPKSMAHLRMMMLDDVGMLCLTHGSDAYVRKIDDLSRGKSIADEIFDAGNALFKRPAAANQLDLYLPLFSEFLGLPDLMANLTPGVPLAVTADGWMRKLPLGAMPLNECLFGQRNPWAYLQPSNARQRSDKSSRALQVFAFSEGSESTGLLPMVQREASYIAALPYGRLQRAAQADARKNALLSALRQPGRIHIAGHGQFNGQDPIQSGLVVSDHTGRQETVTIRDILSCAPLLADELALSSCSGFTQSLLGDGGTVSFGEYSVQSGVRAAFGHVWKVPDLWASELGVAYQRARQTLPPAQSIQTALQTVDASSAYFGSAAILTSDPRYAFGFPQDA